MADVTIRTLTRAARFSVRCGEADRTAAAEALGVPLIGTIGAIAVAGPRRSLCLGPDEWIVVAPLEDGPAMAAAFAASPAVGSLVEVTNRDVTFAITGPGGEELLAHGCPRDLSKLAPGRGVRTVFDGVSVVLWRFDDRFEMAVWRSYVPFVEALLSAAAREMQAA